MQSIGRQAVQRETGSRQGGRDDGEAGRQLIARQVVVAKKYREYKEACSRQGGRQLRARRQVVYRDAGTMERQAGSRGQKSIGDTRRHAVER
jgi:hypothetical protein